MAKPLTVCVGFHTVPSAMACAFSKLGVIPSSKHMRRVPSVSVTYTKGKSIIAARAMLKEVHGKPSVMA